MAHEQRPLTFQWPDRKEVSLARPAFFLLALLIHATAFYLFQVSYPKAAPIPPPPGEVSLLAPTSEENRTLLRWVSAQRPSFAPAIRQPVPTSMLELEYTPSYATVNARPKRAAEVPLAGNYPGVGEVALLTPPHAPQARTEATPSQGPSTWMHFDSELQARKPHPVANPIWPSLSGEILSPARFLVGVSAEGIPAYIFPQSTSGSPGHDQKAMEQISTIRFEPGEKLTWGMLTIFWGADALKYAPSGTSPTPSAAQP